MVSVERQSWRIYMIESDRTGTRASSPWFSNITDPMIKKIQNGMSRKRENRGSGWSAERSCLWRTEGFRYQISFPRDTPQSWGRKSSTGQPWPLSAFQRTPDRILKPDNKRRYKENEFQICLCCPGFYNPRAIPSSFFLLHSTFMPIISEYPHCSEAFRVYQRYKLLTCSSSLK